MPTTGPTQSTSGNCPPTGTSIGKIEPGRVAICVTPQPSTAGPSLPQGRASHTAVPAVPVSVVTSVPGAAATASPAFFTGQPNAPGIQNLGMFVATRFGDRPQILQFQPRSTGVTKSPVVVTTSNASGGLPAGQRIVIPHTSPIRLSGPGNHSSGSSIQVMNLSVSNPTSGNVNSQLTIKPNLPFLVTNDPTSRNIRIQSGEPLNVKAPNAATNVRLARTPISGTQARQIINLTTTGGSTLVSSAMNPQQITIPKNYIIQGTGKGQQVINIQVPKNQLVLNPTSSLTSGATIVSNFTTSHGKSVIPANSVMTIATNQFGRQTIIPGSQVSAPGSFPNNQQRIITAIPGQQHVIMAGTLKPGVITSTAISPLKQTPGVASTASPPRPSILNRKRVIEQPPSTLSLKTQQIKPSESIKLEPGTVNSDAIHDLQISSQSSGFGSQESTPRKRQRKQQLESVNLSTSVNMKLLSDHEETKEVSHRVEDEEFCESDEISQEELEEEDSTPEPYFNQNARKPRLSLITTYGMPWKSLQHHFLRYTDVRPKAEKKLTLSELSNEGLQKKNGWKIHHLATQMEEMSDNETEINDRLNFILETFDQKISPLPLLDEPINPDFPVKVSTGNKLADLIRGNIQRSTIFQDQVNESRQLLIKLTNDHRERVGRLTRKNINKRTCISK